MYSPYLFFNYLRSTFIKLVHAIQCTHPWLLALGQSRHTRSTLDRVAGNSRFDRPVWGSLFCVKLKVTGKTSFCPCGALLHALWTCSQIHIAHFFFGKVDTNYYLINSQVYFYSFSHIICESFIRQLCRLIPDGISFPELPWNLHKPHTGTIPSISSERKVAPTFEATRHVEAGGIDMATMDSHAFVNVWEFERKKIASGYQLEFYDSEKSMWANTWNERCLSERRLHFVTN